MKSLQDPAQDLYKNKASEIEVRDNNALVALGLAIASWVPFVNYLNFFLLYNIVSTVFAFRVLKDSSRNVAQRRLALLSLIINGVAFLFSAIRFGLVIYSFFHLLQYQG